MTKESDFTGDKEKWKVYLLQKTKINEDFTGLEGLVQTKSMTRVSIDGAKEYP